MRKFIFGLCLASSTLATSAQGYIGFQNHVGAPYNIDAPVFDTDCQTRLQGSGYLWQVYAGISPDVLQPLSNIGQFSSAGGAGYMDQGVAFPFPGVPVDTVVYTQLRAWQGSAGPTYEAAVANGGKYGVSNIVPEPVSPPLASPLFPIGLQSFCLIPEPYSLVLMVCGLAWCALVEGRGPHFVVIFWKTVGDPPWCGAMNNEKGECFSRVGGHHRPAQAPMNRSLKQKEAALLALLLFV